MKSIFPRVLCALALAGSLISCGNSLKGKSLEEMTDASPGDSLLYYFGQIQAASYWRKAETDTTLNTPAARESYLRGIHTALKLVGDDESFNAGVLAGIQMAANIRKFNKEYNISLHPDVLYQSMAYGLEGDVQPGDDTFNEDFYRILGQIKENNDKEEQSLSEKALRAAARKQNMTPLSAELFRRTEQHGEGMRLVDDTRVQASVKMTHDGHPINVNTPDEIKVGATYVNPILNQALRSMNEGEQAVFLTTAKAIFDHRCLLHNLQPEDIVKIDISVGRILSKAPDTNRNTDGSKDSPTTL